MNWIPGLKFFKKHDETNNEQFIDSNGVVFSIYHEKQVKELCALHALNNLFQEPFFTKAMLDNLCVE